MNYFAMKETHHHSNIYPMDREFTYRCLNPLTGLEKLLLKKKIKEASKAYDRFFEELKKEGKECEFEKEIKYSKKIRGEKT